MHFLVGWDWQFVIERLFPKLLSASVITIEIALLSIIFGTIIGFIVALMKISHIGVLRIFGQLYTWVFRGIPLIVQLFIIYFGVSAAFAINLEAKTAAIVGISLCGGGYIAEIVRAAILSIDKGQMEAALSLGMTRSQALRRIIIPQTYLRLLPPMSNEYINLVKDTALASTITLAEMLRVAQTVATNAFKPFEAFITVGAFYLFITTVLTLAFGALERKLGARGK